MNAPAAWKTIKHRSGGFTLLEMMAATAILGMVGLLIGVTAASFHRSFAQAQKVAAELARNLAMDRLVEGSFANAVPFMWLDENNVSKQVFLGEPDELYLTSLHRAYDGDSGALRFIRLYREDDKLKCDYASTPLLPWLELKDQKYETEIFAENVSSISFLYCIIEDDEISWVERWDEDDFADIPLAIQITVEWRDGTKERWLRRTAGSSENSTYGG